jgi:putative selenate reductase
VSDRFHPLSFDRLVEWIGIELEQGDRILGIPRDAVFVPRVDHRFRSRLGGGQGIELETPFGVAAGPHTQLAENIVAAWLCGARVIELKTVQQLDDLDVHKPCIDVTDEGYNVEWSQELRIEQSFEQYLQAWVLVHALHRHLGFPGDQPGALFDMSIGYDLAGIRGPKVQWYLDSIADASAHLPSLLEVVARRWPMLADLEVPARITDRVTLSTMHGCPPDEIERIATYLLEERGLHTQVKCNPTLLGPETVRGIVNDELGFVDVPIPDEAFGHDLRYEDAVPMFRRLAQVAAGRGLRFGLKLSNTLEVQNWRSVFDRDPTMYLSGRALHPVTVNLAARLAEDLPAVPFSFAGGADAFNVAELLACGIPTVTVCSDLLKTGGYLRLGQYPERIDAAFDAIGATDTADLIRRRAEAWGDAVDPADVAAMARVNLRRYAEAVRRDPRYRKATYRTDHSKTSRELGLFDCIKAPCLDECPIDQQVPRYMRAVREGDLDAAVRITRADNPAAAVLGTVCDHHCELTCVRTHLDEPLAIRHIKRAIMEHEAAHPLRVLEAPSPTGRRVAVIGAGPAGLAAAERLARAGIAVTILEAQPYAGGMVGGAIPAYRLPRARLEQDLARLLALGVETRYGVRAGVDVTLPQLTADGFDAVFVAVGAQRAKTLGLPGEEAEGVVDGVSFLRAVRDGQTPEVRTAVAVVGAGDTAMDCARTARRLGAAWVGLVYRRTVDQMPADPEEIQALREEGIETIELARPSGLRVEGGRLTGLRCLRTEYRGDRDASGRKVPHDVDGSEFEIPLETLIVAVSQHAVLDLFEGAPPQLTADGSIATDPDTLETSIPGVFAGGDVAAPGPASIVRATADGRRAAAAIATFLGVELVDDETDGETGGLPGGGAPWPQAHPDVDALIRRRAHRDHRVPIRSTALGDRGGFDETTLAYTADEAVREASRCLDCDALCSLCVGVCPNLALLTYEVEPSLGRAGRGGPTRTTIEQPYQVAVLTDLCNECGDCVTVCPTSGAPYRDKPRLYLDRGEFEAEASNAFLLLGVDAIEGRFGGRTHGLALEAEGWIRYTTPDADLVLDARTLKVHSNGSAETGPAAGGVAPDLGPASIMATLLEGLRRSAPHLLSPTR